MTRHLFLRVTWTLVLVAAGPSAGFAQQTRTEQLDGQRADRARDGPPEPRTLFEKLARLVEKAPVPGQGLPRKTVFYPEVGTVTPGSSLGFGGGYRRSFANDNVLLDVSGVITVRDYRVGRIELSLPRLLAHTLEIKGHATYRYFPQEDFYGLGQDSRQDARTDFLIEEREYAAQVFWRPRSWLTFAWQTARLHPRLGSGTDRRFPGTDTRFTEATAPGLTRRTVFLENGGFAEIDYRDADGNPRRGGRYAVYVSRYDDRRDRGYDFSRVSTHIEQYVPLFDSKRVLAFRVRTNHLDAEDGSRVPFYYMSSLGGRQTIRGVDDLRFRDAQAWVASAEYRWEAISGLDLALFYDRGGVAPRWEDLSIRHANDAYGVAVRAGTARAVFFSTEVSFGAGEGLRFSVAFSGPMKIDRWLR